MTQQHPGLERVDLSEPSTVAASRSTGRRIDELTDRRVARSLTASGSMSNCCCIRSNPRPANKLAHKPQCNNVDTRSGHKARFLNDSHRQPIGKQTQQSQPTRPFGCLLVVGKQHYLTISYHIIIIDASISVVARVESSDAIDTLSLTL